MLRATSLDEIVPFAVEGYPPGAVVLDVPEDLPYVQTDPGLLERVVANLVSNAVRHARPARPCVVGAAVGRDVRWSCAWWTTVPACRTTLKGQLFAPFQRLGDTTGTGPRAGARRGRRARDGRSAPSSRAEDTPGGGLTMLVTSRRCGACA